MLEPLVPPVPHNGTGGPPSPHGAVAGTHQDSVAPLLQLLASPQIHHLLNSIDAPRSSQDAAALDGLLQAAGSAAVHRDAPRALAALAEYVNRNPEHASALLANPSLNAIQGDVKELIRHITMDAKGEAVRLIGVASGVVDAAARHPEGLDARGILAVAERFVESAQLVNYIRAAELSQAVIGFYAPAPIEVMIGAQRAVRPHPARGLVRSWWRTVPLLVLLLGWLALGVAAGAIALLARLAGVELLSASTIRVCVDFWGVGFLALVVFQFWISVRNFR
jgi:hypothetical protein